MTNRLLCLLITSVFVVSGCRTAKEDPETSPVGPSVLSDAVLAEALKGPVNFRRHIQPLLQHNCVGCHDGKQMPGLVDFLQRERVMSAGPHGLRVVPGDPDKSLIVKNLSLTHAPVKTMPPVGNRLTPVETRVLRKWIAEGAVWE